MASRRVRLLAIDVDGTLLDSTGRIPPAHAEAVAAAHAAQIKVVLATGRVHHFAQPVVDALGVPVATIVNNGAVARDAGGRTAIRRVLTGDVASTILDEIRGFDDSVALVFDRPDRQIVFEGMDWTHPHRQGYYRRNHAFLTQASLREALAEEDPIQVMFNGGVEPMRNLVSRLRGLSCADRCTVAVTEYEARDFSLVDVNGPNCSKGTTLARLAALLDIPSAQVMAVGDNWNDLEMLEFAGVPVVMSNATNAIKQRGFPVVPDHDAGGLAVAIRRYALERDP
jgi:Cof subfamily protein (haloacid dehalogenase superfamily)